MVERWDLPFDFGGPEMTITKNGSYVRNSDYARLQEQVEALAKERDRTRLHLSAWKDSAKINLHRASAAEAERDRLRTALEKQDEADRLLDEGDDVAAMIAYADAKALRLAALQKEPQP